MIIISAKWQKTFAVISMRKSSIESTNRLTDWPTDWPTDRPNDRLNQLTDLTKRRQSTPTEFKFYSVLVFIYFFATWAIFGRVARPIEICKWARMECWAFQYVLNLYCVIIWRSLLYIVVYTGWHPSKNIESYVPNSCADKSC